MTATQKEIGAVRALLKKLAAAYVARNVSQVDVFMAKCIETEPEMWVTLMHSLSARAVACVRNPAVIPPRCSRPSLRLFPREHGINVLPTASSGYEPVTSTFFLARAISPFHPINNSSTVYVPASWYV